MTSIATSPVRGVIFDLNGVLIKPPTASAFHRLSRLAEIDLPMLEQLYWRHRPDYDRGTLGSGEYWQRTGSDANHSYSPDRVRALVAADSLLWSTANPTMVRALASLTNRGVRTAILSNTPRALWREVARQHEWAHIPAVTTLSFRLGMLKPEPAIFHHCLAALGTEPSQTIFIDDRSENIEAARALGVEAWLFTQRDQQRIARELHARSQLRSDTTDDAPMLRADLSALLT